ncbi:cation:proton antiporter [Candidatus Margulisiibacteriota bacterium]
MNFILHLTIIIFSAFLAGKLFEKFRLTEIIGFILVGIIFGPSLINWLSVANLITLDPLIIFALSAIALLIGMKLQIPLLKTIKWQALIITFTQAFLTFILVSVITYLFMIVFHVKYAFAISLLFGAIAMATAPATVYALIEELKAKGPLTNLLLVIVAIDDAIAIFIYSLVLVFTAFVTHSEAILNLSVFLFPLKEIVLPIIIGLLSGGLFILITKELKDQIISSIILFIILIIVVFCSEHYQISTLMSAMILGFLAGNFNNIKKRTIYKLSAIEHFIFIFFFVTAGASLKFHVLYQVALLALVYFLVRAFSKILGGYYGCKFARSDLKIRHWLGLGLLPQAGVAIAFLHEINRILPHVSQYITTVVLASIIISELIGPLSVELALLKSGEGRIHKSNK